MIFLMKRVSVAVLLLAIVGSLYLVSCSKENKRGEDISAPMNETLVSTSGAASASEDAKPIIDLIDHTISYCLTTGINLQNKEAVSKVYLEQAQKLGYEVNENFTEYDYSNYSGEFKERLAILNTAYRYDSQEVYFADLKAAIENAYASGLSEEEKNTLVFHLQFTIDALRYAEKKSAITESRNYSKAKCSGWWSCWGKCLAGTLGGAVTGAVTIGLGGAAVGTVALPVVGTVSGGLVGAIGGGIGGALTGAAASC